MVTVWYCDACGDFAQSVHIFHICPQNRCRRNGSNTQDNVQHLQNSTVFGEERRKKKKRPIAEEDAYTNCFGQM